MKAVTIEDALQQVPFRPFELISDSGKAFLVKHPDFLLFNEAKTVCVVTEGEHVRVLDLDHLSGLIFRTVTKHS